MIYVPNYDLECRICDTKPTVVVIDHPEMPATELCGVCFFGDRSMTNPELWPDEPESIE